MMGARQDLGSFELGVGQGPNRLPTTTEQLGPQAQHCLGTRLGPTHARLFQPRPNYPFAGALYRSAADGIPLGPELSIAHPILIGLEVVDL